MNEQMHRWNETNGSRVWSRHVAMATNKQVVFDQKTAEIARQKRKKLK